MTQELIDLRTSILEGRYEDALAIVDELEGMSKQAVLRNIQSYLERMLTHLIKAFVEQRLTNSWAASIKDSLIQIKRLNLKENKKSYYIKADEWEEMLAESLQLAITTASVEVMNGNLSPFQLSTMVDKPQIKQTAKIFLDLTYAHSSSDLFDLIDENLAQLPGGQNWKEGRR